MEYDYESIFASMGAGTSGHLPMPKMTTPGKVRAESQKRSQNIYRGFELLQEIMLRHQAAIEKRWLKKTKEQKKAILVKAWGDDMPGIHRPDFDAFRKETEQQRDDGTRLRSAYMWPYINQEDLTKPKLLLLFLAARASAPPSDFAASASGAMHLGIVSKAIVPDFLNEHVMLLHFQEKDSYGKLLHWSEHPDAFDWSNNLQQYLPGEGLLVLECQERSMDFLVKCAKGILHEFTDEDLIKGDKQPSLVQNWDLDTSNLNTSLATLAERTPYRIPSEMDVDCMVELLQAREDAAKDHLLLMREDPQYYAHRLGDSYEHRQEQIKDTRGREHMLFRTNQQDILWARVIREELISALVAIEFWTELRKQAEQLRELYFKYLPAPGEDLEEELLETFLRFQHYLVEAAKGPLTLFKTASTPSPPWRSKFTRQPESSATDPQLKTMSKPGVVWTKAEKDLLWPFQLLWDQGQQLWLARLPNVMDELQRRVDRDKECKALITGFVAEILSDLSIIGECQRHLASFQPWARGFEDLSAEKDEGLEEDFEVWARPVAAMISVLGKEERSAATYGAPTEGRFTYPVDKRRSRDVTDALRRAEENLDTFWARVRTRIEKGDSSIQRSVVWQLLGPTSDLRRTPAWVEPETLATHEISKVITGLDNSSLRDIAAPDDSLSGRKLTQKVAKEKVKTKGESNEENLQPRNDELLDVAYDNAPAFQVDARAYKTLSTLFHSPKVGSTPGELPWVDFLHAMTSMHFHARQLYGSVWQFTPSTEVVNRSIQFHEPHPGNKLPYWTARRIGRRLNRRYGWSAESFKM